jgi:Regulator of chromosome condensation (RCC1) repeat
MRRALLALAVLALTLTGCPKKHKPPPMARAWLGPTDACVMLRTGVLACSGVRAASSVPSPTKELGANVIDMAIGAGVMCALRGDGTAACRDAGVPFAAGALAISAAGNRACAALLDGSLKCTGVGGGPAAGGGVAAGSGVGGVAAGDGVRGADEPPVHTGSQKAFGIALGEEIACAPLRAVPGEPARVRCAPGGDVLIGEEVEQVTAGAAHACALIKGGSVRCWGRGAQGQLGNGGAVDSSVPVTVMGVENVAEVRAGARHTCARMKNGTVACWGANDRHQLADGTTTQRPRALPIFGIVAAQEVTAAGDAACVRLQDATVRCWGANDSGHLGDGTNREHVVPMPVKWAAPN